MNETRSNNTPRGPHTIIDEIKSPSGEVVQLTYLESIKHRFLTDCRSDATINSRCLFSNIMNDTRELLFNSLRKNISPIIFYPSYENYNTYEQFWNFVETGDILKRNAMLRDDVIRNVRLVISCLSTVLKQLKKKKCITLTNAMKIKYDNIKPIKDVEAKIESLKSRFKEDLEIVIDEDIMIDLKKGLFQAYQTMNLTQLKRSAWNTFVKKTTCFPDVLEDTIHTSFFKEGTEEDPWILLEIKKEFEALVNQLCSIVGEIKSNENDVEALEQLLSENAMNFIQVSRSIIPPSRAKLRPLVSRLLSEELESFFVTFQASFSQFLKSTTANINLSDLNAFVEQILDIFVTQCSKASKAICDSIVTEFVLECSEFFRMAYFMLNERFRGNTSKINIQDLVNYVDDVRKNLTSLNAAMPHGYRPDHTQKKIVCLSTRKIAEPSEDISNSLLQADQKFKKNGMTRPNKNSTIQATLQVNDRAMVHEDEHLHIVTFDVNEFTASLSPQIIENVQKSLKESQHLKILMATVADRSNCVDAIKYMDAGDPIDAKALFIFYYDYDLELFESVTRLRTPHTTIVHVVVDPSPLSQANMYACSLMFMKAIGKLLDISLCLFFPPNLMVTREYHKRTNMLEFCSIYRSIVTAVKTLEHVKARQESATLETLEMKISNSEAEELGFTVDDETNDDESILSRIYHQFASTTNSRKFYKLCHDDKHLVSNNPSLLLEFVKDQRLLTNLENFLLLRSVQRISMVSISGNRTTRYRQFNWRGSTFREASAPSPFSLVNLRVLDGYNFVSDDELISNRLGSDHRSSIASTWKRLINTVREDGLLCYSIFVVQTLTQDPKAMLGRVSMRPEYSEIFKNRLCLEIKKKGFEILPVSRQTTFEDTNALSIQKRQLLQKKLEEKGQKIDHYWFRKSENDSLFGCLSLAVTGNKFSSTDILTVITDELNRNREHYMTLFKYKNDSSQGFTKSIYFNSYVKNLSSSSIYGDYLSLVAFSKALERDVVIYFSDDTDEIVYHRIQYNDKVENESGRITLAYIFTKQNQPRFVPIISLNNSIFSDQVVKRNKRNHSMIDESESKRRRHFQTSSFKMSPSNLSRSLNDLHLLQSPSVVNYSQQQHHRIIEIATVFGTTIVDRTANEKFNNLAVYTNLSDSDLAENIWIGELEPTDVQDALSNIKDMVLKYINQDNLNDETLRHYTVKTTGRSISLQSLQKIYKSTQFFDLWHFDRFSPYMDGVLQDSQLKEQLRTQLEPLNTQMPKEYQTELLMILAELVCKIGLSTKERWRDYLNKNALKKILTRIGCESNEEAQIQSILDAILSFVESLETFKDAMLKVQSFFDTYVASIA